MIEPLVVSLKSVNGKPATMLRRRDTGVIVAQVFDEEYTWLFQQATKVHFPDKGAANDPSAD